MAFERELEVALEAADRAGSAILALYKDFERIPNAPASITTQADRDSQEIILQHIHTIFPTDSLCAEEKTPTLEGKATTGSRVWIIDPIDGTRGFAQKNGEFSVMIAFVNDGDVVVGVVLEPVLARTTFAVRGMGCTVRDKTGTRDCHVTTIPTLDQATLVQSRSRHDRGPTGPVRLLKPGKVRETYSAGIKLADVARGDADLYVISSGTFRDWDLCAGHILVEEAGGRMTDIVGSPLQYGLEGHIQNRGLVATNGLLHRDAITGMARRTVED